MLANSAAPAFSDIRIEGNLIPYLQLTGWQEAKEANARWFVYQFTQEEGDALEIVLPRNSRARDLRIYVDNTINLLSALSEEPVDDVVRRIVYYDTDVLHSRNIQTGEYNSITLRMAAQQVRQLKQLVNFSAFSEHQPKPHF